MFEFMYQSLTKEEQVYAADAYQKNEFISQSLPKKVLHVAVAYQKKKRVHVADA